MDSTTHQMLCRSSTLRDHAGRDAENWVVHLPAEQVFPSQPCQQVGPLEKQLWSTRGSLHSGHFSPQLIHTPHEKIMNQSETETRRGRDTPEDLHISASITEFLIEPWQR